MYPLASRFSLIRCLVPVLLAWSLAPAGAQAKSAAEIDIGVQEALRQFRSEVKGGGKFLGRANGVLVFPAVYKAGIGIGGEYGEGALLVGGKTVGYYSTAAASIGFQLGAQKKSIVIVFMTDAALADFRKSEGWKAGVDGSVALIEWGVGEDINTVDIKDPVVGFVFSNKGLMYNLTLEGSKFTRLEK
jgi:lipid-binding SYLF domain-containing protein